MKTAEFVICSQCLYWEDCENKENHDGCYFGEKKEEENMNMYDELKAWADKWGVKYTEELANEKWCCHRLYFESETYYPAEFLYNPETGDFSWYGGD